MNVLLVMFYISAPKCGADFCGFIPWWIILSIFICYIFDPPKIYIFVIYLILSRFIYLRGWCLFGTDWRINHRWGSIFLLFIRSGFCEQITFTYKHICNACWQTEGKHSQLSLSNAQGFQDLKYGPITRTNRGQLTNDKIVICVRQFVQALDHPPGGKWQHLYTFPYKAHYHRHHQYHHYHHQYHHHTDLVQSLTIKTIYLSSLITTLTIHILTTILLIIIMIIIITTILITILFISQLTDSNHFLVILHLGNFANFANFGPLVISCTTHFLSCSLFGVMTMWWWS